MQISSFSPRPSDQSIQVLYEVSQELQEAVEPGLETLTTSPRWDEGSTPQQTFDLPISDADPEAGEAQRRRSVVLVLRAARRRRRLIQG